MMEFVTPHLRTVLKTYQNSATKSLQGPGVSLVVNPLKRQLHSPDESIDESQYVAIVPPPPEIPQPILSTADTGRGVVYQTVLEGKPIGCFMLGGEQRLCFPQVLNTVLKDFTLDQINCVFDELRIFCSQCTPEQLHEFKVAKILPEDVKASGLITRTNAERLCSALLHSPDHQRGLDKTIGPIDSFRVYHRCFGKCEGICMPDLYSYKEPTCIECIQCHGLFTPQKFVCHVHQPNENQTLHWGFDSNKWRIYMQVALDEPDREKCNKMLDVLFDQEQQDLINMIAMQRDVCHVKRKADIEELSHQSCKAGTPEVPIKKVRLFDDSIHYDYQCQQQAMLLKFNRNQQPPLMAFRPWTQLAPKHLLPMPYSQSAISYLSQEPPILQNPERVIKVSECERFERTFQPNVALAPRKNYQLPATKDAVRLPIISTGVHIKQERPSTPSDESISPDLRVPSPQQQLISNPKAPISPEALSGSNEITSSTSPVPVLLHKTANEVIIHSPKTSPANDNNDENYHQSIRFNHNHHHHNHHHNNRAQTPLRIVANDMVVVNSEFELSTDTDDDSLIGEPDSSNHSASWEHVLDALKDPKPINRSRMYQIVKSLMRQNVKLCKDLHRRTEQVNELLQKQREWESYGEQNHQQHNLVVVPDMTEDTTIVSTPELIELERKVQIVRSSTDGNETEVIRMPLKKSARRSPEETVVIIHPPKTIRNVIGDTTVTATATAISTEQSHHHHHHSCEMQTKSETISPCHGSPVNNSRYLRTDLIDIKREDFG